MRGSGQRSGWHYGNTLVFKFNETRGAGANSFPKVSSISSMRATTSEDAMAEVTREEIDAKFAAAAAQTDTKFARLEAKIDGLGQKMDARFDVLITQMQGLDARMGDTQARVSSLKSYIITSVLGLAALLVALAAILPAIYDLGQKNRDIIREEVKQQLPK